MTREARLFLLLALAAGSIPVVLLAISAIGQRPTFNDFHSYWLAARLVMAGASPYDLEAMRALGRSEGLQFVLGTGYSYPLPFAFLMIPFALLPFRFAIIAFSAVSVIGFGLVVAWWLTRFHPTASPARLGGAALAAGLFPPIFGSLDNGQANLVVLVPLAIGIAGVGASGRHRLLGGAMLGLATMVKLVPGVIVAVLLASRRWGAALAAIATVLGALVVTEALVTPQARGGTWLSRLFEPDPYFTNQSINGFISRLVLASGRSSPLAPGAFDPYSVTVVVTAAFGLATVAILGMAFRVSASEPVLLLGIAFALVGATIAAPKNSFWNQALALPALGLLLAVEAPDLDLGRIGRVDRWLLATGWIGWTIQTVLWITPPSPHGSFRWFVTLVGSSALYGMLALWVLLARRLKFRSRGSPGRRMADAR